VFCLPVPIAVPAPVIFVRVNPDDAHASLAGIFSGAASSQYAVSPVSVMVNPFGSW